jgi:Uma2 family endonuclease
VQQLLEEAVHPAVILPDVRGLAQPRDVTTPNLPPRSLPQPARDRDLPHHEPSRYHPHAMATEHESAPAKPLTQAEFRAWLDERPSSDLGHYELLNGQIVVSPPAGWPHGQIGVNVTLALRQHADRHQLGRVLDSSAGFDLPSGDTLEPDASLVSTARWNAAPAPVFGQFLKVVPDLVVEILSPSTRRRDLREKKDVYARNGVDEYWVIDPRAASITVFSRGGDAFDEGTTLASGPLASRLLPDLDATVEQLLAI